MGVECSKSQVSELENVDEEDLDRHLYKIDAALGEEGDVHVHNDEKMTHIMKKTTHKHASGCCARGGKADLYSTKIVISKKDGELLFFWPLLHISSPQNPDCTIQAVK
mmetsp:Transcript_22074/g.35509  ORF Transcript_22074/g.35509 Transcript_22074/m.35509 type:complete len:108 (+) Transcript_22074:27-350(+)